MKKSWLLILTSILAAGWINQSEAAVVAVGGPGIALGYRQPVQAIVVDPNGTTYQQTVYYDPAIGGVDLDTGWAGPNASVYFPEYGTGYLWYNGAWVDQTGYYWNSGRRIYVGHPHWNDHWAGYWTGPRYHGGYGHGGGWYGGGWRSRPEVSVHVHEKVNVYEHGHHHHH